MKHALTKGFPKCSSCRLFYKDYSVKLREVGTHHHPKYDYWLTDICALQHLYREPMQFPFTVKQQNQDSYYLECGAYVKITNPDDFFCREHIDKNNFQFFKSIEKASEDK